MGADILYSMQQETRSSILTIEQQSKITMTGVDSVDSFSDMSIQLTVNGKRVQITGTKLKVIAFASGSGNFSATGEVKEVRYGGAKGKFFARLFK